MMKVTMERDKAEMKKEAEGIRHKGTEARMQGGYPASFNSINSINTINANNAKESEVRTVMGGIFCRRNHSSNYLTLNAKHSTLIRMALMAVLVLALVLGGGFAVVSDAATNCTSGSDPNVSVWGFTTDGYNISNAKSIKTATVSTWMTDADSTGQQIEGEDDGTDTNDCDLLTSDAITNANKLKIKDRGSNGSNIIHIDTGVPTGKTLSIPFKIRIIGTDEKGDGTCGNKQMWSDFESIIVYNYAADNDNVVVDGSELTFTPSNVIVDSGTTANGCNFETIELDVTSLYNSSPQAIFNVRIVGDDVNNNVEVKQLSEIYIQWAEVTCSATAPTDLTATNIQATQVDLQWTADCTNNDTYTVYRDGSALPAGSGLTCQSGTMTFSDTTVSANTSYSYTVRGYNNTESCESGDSNVVNVTTPSCTDPDPTTGVTVTPASGSTVRGTVTVQATISGEGTPGSGSATVTISGSSACDVTNQTMTWNSGTGAFEYSWDTSACGDPAENPITISVDYSDPDCGTVTNGTSDNITIDNTGPKYTVTSCSDCHDYPPTDATGQRNTPVGAVVGSHSKHPFDCSKCHIKPTTFDHRNGNIDMANPINGDTGASYSKGTSFPQVNDLTGSGLGTCSNVSCHGGSTTPTWGTTGALTCSSCHTNDMGLTATVRRGIFKTGNDFTKTSHHIAGTPADASCEVCHDRSNHTQEGDPVVRVFDEDTGSAILYDGTASSLTPFCLSCHDSDAASRLGANASQPFTDSGDNTAPPDVNTPWTQTYNHSAGAECMECHGDAGGTIGDTLNPKINAHGSTAQKLLNATNQYDVCFQCHNATISKTVTTSETDYGYPTAWSTIPDVQSQFSTSNYAYHPLFAAGRNQPADNLNNNWSNNNYRKADNTTACPDGTCSGLDNNFVDGWESTSLVTCTDCHDNAGTGARGPHGSAAGWLLKMADPDVTVSTAGQGTIYPNRLDLSSNGTPITNYTYTKYNICVNCHRGDIYGWGAKNIGPSVNNETFARLSHRGGGARPNCQGTDTSKGPGGVVIGEQTGEGGLGFSGCLNCHGGGEVAGIHGSNLGPGSQGDALGKRFSNGNSWPMHWLGDTSNNNGGQIGCYTGTGSSPGAAGSNLTTCSHHNGWKNVNPNYLYAWQ